MRGSNRRSRGSNRLLIASACLYQHVRGASSHHSSFCRETVQSGSSVTSDWCVGRVCPTPGQSVAARDGERPIFKPIQRILLTRVCISYSKSSDVWRNDCPTSTRLTKFGTRSSAFKKRVRVCLQAVWGFAQYWDGGGQSVPERPPYHLPNRLSQPSCNFLPHGLPYDRLPHHQLPHRLSNFDQSPAVLHCLPHWVSHRIPDPVRWRVGEHFRQ